MINLLNKIDNSYTFGIIVIVVLVIAIIIVKRLIKNAIVMPDNFTNK